MRPMKSSSSRQARGAIAGNGSIPAKVRIRHGWAALALLAIAGAPCLAATFTVNFSADIANPSVGLVTLRRALAEADAAGGANVINLPAALGPYRLALGALETSGAANSTLQIQGDGGSAVIDGDGLSGVFRLSGGTVSLTSLTIQNGSAPSPNPGSNGICNGGGIHIAASTTVYVTSSTITNNQTPNASGGGICVRGTLNLANSTVSNNHGSNGGGGIRVLTDASANVTASTVSDNWTTVNGAAGGGIENQGTLTVTGSTISGNTADTAGGVSQESDGSTTLSNVTIAGNGSNGSAQLESFGGANISVVSTIIANPLSGVNCRAASQGTITSNGHNLDSANNCGFASAGDLINADPVLGPLQNNGGTTATMALLAGSKAIDHGANPLALATDQRGDGFAREVGSGADIGAFEAQPPVVDGQAVEYINTLDFPNSPGGHFFYTADPDEQAFVDSGGAGRFTRTGRAFATGGYVPLCRFYGSVQPGPNSHFFTADEAECSALKALQITPIPTTVQQWNDEGLGFNVSAPVLLGGGIIGCPSGMLAVYRGYNNAFALSGKNPWDSNHRYSTTRADITALVSANGWTDEGIVFCALE